MFLSCNTLYIVHLISPPSFISSHLSGASHIIVDRAHPKAFLIDSNEWHSRRRKYNRLASLLRSVKRFERPVYNTLLKRFSLVHTVAVIVLVINFEKKLWGFSEALVCSSRSHFAWALKAWAEYSTEKSTSTYTTDFTISSRTLS